MFGLGRMEEKRNFLDIFFLLCLDWGEKNEKGSGKHDYSNLDKRKKKKIPSLSSTSILLNPLYMCDCRMIWMKNCFYLHKDNEST